MSHIKYRHGYDLNRSLQREFEENTPWRKHGISTEPQLLDDSRQENVTNEIFLELKPGRVISYTRKLKEKKVIYSEKGQPGIVEKEKERQKNIQESKHLHANSDNWRIKQATSKNQTGRQLAWSK